MSFSRIAMALRKTKKGPPAGFGPMKSTAINAFAPLARFGVAFRKVRMF